MTQWEELSELAGTLPLHYTPEDLNELLLKASEIFRKHGDDYWADFYLKLIERRREEMATITTEFKDLRVWDFLANFAIALEAQLREDQKEWGDTWKYRIRGGQEARIRAELDKYFDQWEHAGNPIPWLKIAGLAMIAWIRETFPQYFPK